MDVTHYHLSDMLISAGEMENFAKIVIILRKVTELWKNCHDSLFHAICQIGHVYISLNITRQVRVTDRLSHSLFSCELCIESEGTVESVAYIINDMGFSVM